MADCHLPLPLCTPGLYAETEDCQSMHSGNPLVVNVGGISSLEKAGSAREDSNVTVAMLET